VIAPDDMRTAEEIIHGADTAMYQAKSAGGGHSVMFGADPQSRRLSKA
jgi:predicted signal transduction protein with EAL and GGDEF domain